MNALQQFPTGYQQSLVRNAYITPAALAAFRTTGTLPAGTVIVMDQFAAKRDAQGQLLHDPQRRLIPGRAELVAVRVKLAPGQTVASDQLPPGLRNRTWVYATFDPLSRQRDSLDNTVCSACHQQAASWDYLFTRPELVTAVQQNAPQLDRCDLAGRQPCQVPGP